MAVTGYEEAIEVYRDPEVFSACNSVAGPFPPLEGQPDGDDISEYVEQNREHWFFYEYLITMDGEPHERERGLLRRIMTPRRLRENAEAMSAIADQCLIEDVATGGSEVIADYSRPFTTLVIADLLGMPDEDRENLRLSNFKAKVVGALGGTETVETNLLEYCEERFLEYVIDRRANPQDDVLTQLGNRHLSRRHHSGAGRGRTVGIFPLRRRPGHHRAADRFRTSHHRRRSRSCRRNYAPTRS